MRPRLAIWYLVSVGALGVMPLLAPALADAGLTDTTIAATLLAFPVAKLGIAPAVAWLADRTGRTVAPLVGASAVALLGATALGFASAPAWLVLAVAVLAIGQAPVFPLADALTVAVLGEDRRSYGRIRAIGSLGFIAVILATSQLTETWAGAPRAVLAGMLALSLLAALPLPDAPPAGARPSLAKLWHTARSTGLLPLLAATTLHGLTLALYNWVFALHTARLGVAPLWTGVAIGAGVLLEVGVLWRGRSLLDRFAPAQALTLAIAVGVVRWALTAAGPAPVVLAAQVLHGLSYGLFWVAGVALFSERAPRELAASVQTLLTMSTFGLGPLLAMAGSALWLPTLGTAGTFGVAAVVSGVGATLAMWASRAPDG